MTKALVLYAHPCGESFAAALHRRVVDTITGRGWQVDDCDLYAEGFNPVLSPEERRAYDNTATNRNAVQSYVDRLQAADALILPFPVWNFGFPAILKGYFDRVFLPGVSFHLQDGKVAPALTNITKLAAVTTYGGTRLRAFLAGDPPRKIVTRLLRFVAQVAPTKYLALYDLNNASAATRAVFLDRVGREMERF